MIFEADQSFDGDAINLIFESVRIGRPWRAAELDMREGEADAEADIGRPALAHPAILAAEEDLVEAVGELHGLERVADAVRRADLDAVTGAETPTMAPLSAMTLAWL